MRAPALRLLTASLAALALAACDNAPANDNVGDVSAGANGAVASSSASLYPYHSWDSDTNRSLNESEFTTAARDRGYSRWNTTSTDAGLDENEFGTGLFATWDRDGNSQLTEVEWREGTGRWYESQSAAGEWNAWNTSGDGYLDANEFNAGVRRTGLFSTWDADRNGSLADNEFGRSLFGRWDANRDGTVDEHEWLLGAGGVNWF